jgi:Ca-activated chloride channel family protein
LGLAVALAAMAIGVSSAQAAGLLVAQGGFGGVLEMKQHDVHVTINNGVAVTEVDEVFVNTENRVVEALYTFPVPKQASVANFSMWIGGKEMIGEVVEKQRARQIYDSYKQVRRDPGLLEQVDYRTFEMRIFPIPARGEQRVRITYYQELDFDHDWANYVYPLATSAVKGVDQKVTGRFSLAFDVKSEVPIVAMKSPSHGDEFAIVRRADDHCWQASLEAAGGDLGRDLVIAFQTQRPRTGLDVVASRTAGEDGYFLLTLTAGKELEEAAGGADYVFLLDVSGSMARDEKLGLSRNSLAAFVDALGADDRFELIAFNLDSQTLFGSLKKMSPEAKEQARVFMNSQKARGGTVLRPAMQAAYRYRDADRPLNVVVLSDGMTEQREQRELLQLIGERPAGATVFCVGIGNDVNRPLLSQLAHDAGGLATFISAGDDFERQAEAFRRKLTKPAASHVKLAFQGGGTFDVEPQELPNLYHGQPVRIYGRYRQAGPIKVELAADILGSPLKQTIDLELPQTDDGNPEIERMWAFHRLERLMDDSRRTGSIGLVQDEIVRLCEGYSIASEYASFIVLENDAEYGRWKIERRNATRIDRDRRSQAAVRQKLEQLRQQAQQNLGPSKPNDPMNLEQTQVAQAVDPLQGAKANAPRQFAPAADSRPGDIVIRNSRGGNRGGGGGGIGGGAIDPITGLIAVGMGAMGLVARLRRSWREEEPAQSGTD